METRRFWNVLIVDDEPDMHAVTDLALKRETIFGAKLKLHHVNSAAEARAFFENRPEAAATAAAFVDVVMETDDAGLRLCQWIREQRGEHATQLVLRTGQPGKAPPRQIIDDYNISAYLTKVEATPDRLYSTLKTAFQNFYNLQYLFWTSQLYDAIAAHCKSPREVFEAIKALMGRPPAPETGIEFHRAMDFGGVLYLGQGAFAERSEYEKLKPDLLERGRQGLAANGIALVDNNVVVQTAPIGTDRVATLVVRDAVYPRNLHDLYGSVWRQKLAYLAELFQRL